MNRMRRTGSRGRKRLGMLTFEWILLISLLVIGIIGGLSAVRNALICELSELAESVTALNGCGDNDGDDCSSGSCPSDNGRHGHRWWHHDD